MRLHVHLHVLVPVHAFHIFYESVSVCLGVGVSACVNVYVCMDVYMTVCLHMFIYLYVSCPSACA